MCADFAKLDEALRERAHSTDAMLRELVAEIKVSLVRMNRFEIRMRCLQHVADTGAERTLHTYTEARALKAEAMLYKNACIKVSGLLPLMLVDFCDCVSVLRA
jgi:hypothetical protein